MAVVPRQNGKFLLLLLECDMKTATNMDGVLSIAATVHPQLGNQGAEAAERSESERMRAGQAR